MVRPTSFAGCVAVIVLLACTGRADAISRQPTKDRAQYRCEASGSCRNSW